MKTNNCRLRKIVEEQRREIESLNLHINRLKVCYETAKEEIEKLQNRVRERTKWWQDEALYADKLEQELRQLRVQAAIMREALESIYYGPYMLSKGYMQMIEQALATDAGKDYHNPKDIEALEKAREALAKATYTEEILPNWEYKKIMYEAIEAIDKAIGGNQKVKS